MTKMETEEEKKEHEENTPAKKVRLFSAKEFRKRLLTEEKLTALQDFLVLCSKQHSCILDYLENGGSCLELFHLLETNPEIHPSLLVAIINHVLLEIVSKHPHLHSTAHESCRYFLNNHIALINKSLGLASSSNERKVFLKLLTIIITFSKKFAKDILMHVNFYSANLQVLTKQTGEADSVRNSFIYFLVAFLLDGTSSYPITALFLEKKGLLTSIINGLRYDSSETVAMVMETFKVNILQNGYVSRTVKMNTFSTPVVRDIVNLYNWRGPLSFKNKNEKAEVNQEDKSLVNIAVHSFLMVLCTSPKYGVIFRDHQVGLGKRNCNILMHTVLESLEKPWEHSYAGELVTYIGAACPDLVKGIWANLKTFLEPRVTVQWLSAVEYSGRLVKQLGPECIEFCARELGVNQLAQIIQVLVSPTVILKTLLPESKDEVNHSIRHRVTSVLVEFLKAVSRHLKAAEIRLHPKDFRTLKHLLTEHIVRNFPDAQTVFQNWCLTDDGLGAYSVLEHLTICIDLLELYQDLCPHLLESLNSADLQNFLTQITQPDDDNEHVRTSLTVRVIKLFVNYEPGIFVPNTELFSIVLPLVFKFYSKTARTEYGNETKNTLKLLLTNTGIFESCLEEIDVWIDVLVDLKKFTENTGRTIVDIINRTSENLFEYLSIMSRLLENSEAQMEQNFDEILENLSGDVLDQSYTRVKHQGLSPLLMGALEYLQDVQKQSRSFKGYFTAVLINLLHFQTLPLLYTEILLNSKYREVLSSPVVAYVNGWVREGKNPVLENSNLHCREKLSASLLEGDAETFILEHKEELTAKPGEAQNCLNQTLFYLTQTEITKDYLRNSEKLAKHLIKYDETLGYYIKNIFVHPILLQRFSPLHLGSNTTRGLSTTFLVNITDELHKLNVQKELDTYLRPFRAKLVRVLKKSLKRSFKKPVKFSPLVETVNVIKLEQQECLEVLNVCSDLPIQDLGKESLSFYYNLVVFALENFQTAQKPFSEKIIASLGQLINFLHKTPEQFDSSGSAIALRNHLEIYPHNLGVIDSELFESILTTKSEFCKENALLAAFLLSRRVDFVDVFLQNLSLCVTKKGLILPLLKSMISLKIGDETQRKVYDSFEPTLLKGLQKPQKAGQYFEVYRDVLSELIKKFTAEEVCLPYVDKVHKFDVCEPFHIGMLTAIFTKILDKDINEKHMNNSILTLVHSANLLFKKKAESSVSLTQVVGLMNDYFQKIVTSSKTDLSCRSLCQSENFQLYCKFCLKFGLSGNVALVTSLKLLLEFVNFEENEARLLLDMAGSHSEFLEIVLSENRTCKMELLDLVLTLCQRWPSLMQRNHIPALLAAYRATMELSDRIILTLLQMYEKAANKTNFYDFKLFLWGTAAATHYSVREDIQTSLWRQPKMSDILGILQEEWIFNTVTQYPLDLTLNATKTLYLNEKKVYDLSFFLPMFSSLLAPENEVPTYLFVKSGALSLTIVALGSNDRELRLASCHVLARFHYHVEARRGGKDRFLWIRFVEAISSGTAILRDFKLNNFAAVFLAKMAVILTKPMHPLYVPLSQYLSAKSSPDLATIPELYTFLHSSDVNYSDLRLFILEILRDGLRRENDFLVALHAMAFKLVMELFSSCVGDLDSKVLILSILERACTLDLGRKLLSSSYGLLSWIYEIVVNIDSSEVKLIPFFVRILGSIKDGANSKVVYFISMIVTKLIEQDLVKSLRNGDLKLFFHVIYDIVSIQSDFLTQRQLDTLVCLNNNVKCKYLLEHGCKFYECKEDDVLERIVIKFLSKYSLVLVVRWCT